MESMNEIAGYLSSNDSDYESDDKVNMNESKVDHKNSVNSKSSSSGKSTVNINRYKVIPLRLSADERKMLAVLESALEVCEYTDVVDVTFSHTRKSKMSRIIESLVDVLSIASGLFIANNLTKGEQLISGKSLNDNVPLFADIFEVSEIFNQ